LKYGSWNKTRTDLDRKEGTHCDGILALAYLLSIVGERGKIPKAQKELSVFVPPPKDPLNLKLKRNRARVEKVLNEAFEYKSVTEDIWKKDLD
jgi:hypothetical protein